MHSSSFLETAEWMKTPLGMEVDIGAGHIVLDGFPALRERGTAAPSFRPMSIVATVAHLSYCCDLVNSMAGLTVYTVAMIIYRVNL